MRKKTRVVNVGNVAIGGDNPISIQSMTNTKTKDIKSTIAQIKLLEDEGCEIVRVAVSELSDAQAILKIKKEIRMPIVADIQFDYKLAIFACENGADCVRINPGNIGSKVKVKEVVDRLKHYNIPIRIGVNSGSISNKIIEKCGGVNEESLVLSALEEIEYLESLNFHDIKVSIKSSDVRKTIAANLKFREITDYPLHLGVTEAGNLLRGTVKSSIGIGTLLYLGVGDTIRVSLSDDPVQEVKTAKLILQSLGLRSFGVEIVSCPTCSRTGIDLIQMVDEIEERTAKINKNIKIAVMGCPVNGPGESKEADYGISGLNGEGIIFKKGKVIEKISEDKLVDRLVEIINNN